MSYKDVEGTLKTSQKRDVRKRCGARRICRMIAQVFSIISGFISRHKKSDTFSKLQKKLGRLFSTGIVPLKNTCSKTASCKMSSGKTPRTISNAGMLSTNNDKILV